MLSKVKGKNYLIMEPGEKYYSRVNKIKLDRSLKKIIRALEVGIAFDCNNITYNQTEILNVTESNSICQEGKAMGYGSRL